MALGDGTIIQKLDYVSESVIIECENFVKGVFNSTKKTYSFQITKDMKYAMLNFDSSKVHGTMKMTSITPPHFSDGTVLGVNEPNPESINLAPGLYYNQPMAGATVEIDATLASGKRVAFHGSGGHGRLWAVDSWFKIWDGWHVVHANVGLYTLAYWEPVSRLEKGVKYYSAQLFQNGELIAATQIGVMSKVDYVLFTDVIGGELSGKLADKNTGHVLEFVSPTRGKSWIFELQHITKQFEMSLSGGTGLTGFANGVVGGEVGELIYEGRGFSVQVWLPEVIAMWKFWIVYGIGFLQNGKSFLVKTVSYLV